MIDYLLTYYLFELDYYYLIICEYNILLMVALSIHYIHCKKFYWYKKLHVSYEQYSQAIAVFED